MTLPSNSLKCERERRKAVETSICFTKILINRPCVNTDRLPRHSKYAYIYTGYPHLKNWKEGVCRPELGSFITNSNDFV